MILLELKQMVNVLGICELILVGVFCMAVMEATLETGKGRRTRIWKWGIVILATALLSQLMTFGSGLFDIHFLAERKASWSDDGVLSLVIGGIYLIWNMLKILLPTFMSYVGGVWLYRQERSVKAFSALLTGLGAMLIYRYLYALLKIPFQRGDAANPVYAPPQIWLALLLLGICLTACFLLYWKYLCAQMKKLLDTPDGRMDGFVKAPFLSAIVFAGQLAILSTFAMTPNSTDMSYRFIFIAVTGFLFFAYLLMYWSIFRGITLSTEAMKNRAELGVATHIQANMLPCIFPAFPERQEFDIYATMTPAKEVGGDFYDFLWWTTTIWLWSLPMCPARAFRRHSLWSYGFVLAGMEDSRYREYEWKLDPGDSLYVYTDGVAEATDKDDTLLSGTRRSLMILPC